MKILFLIDSLGKGGAEHLLVNIVNSLDERFENYIIVLNNTVVNLNEKVKNAKIIDLHTSFSLKNFQKIRDEINQVIVTEKIDIVHSHSYWTNLIARFLFKNNRQNHIKFFQNYHSATYDTLWHNKKVRMLFVLDKLTLRKKNFTYIAVSNYVKGILQNKLKIKNAIALENFVNQTDVNYTMKHRTANTKLKLVSVGNFKIEKNYVFMLDALSKLKNLDIEYYIYGDGGLRSIIESTIAEHRLENVFLMGVSDDVLSELLNYDVFVMPSMSESFGLALLEACQVGLPLLLSDIPSFNEIAGTKATYFNPNEIQSLTDAIIGIYLKDTHNFGKGYYQEMLQHYSKDNYMKTLQNLYLQEAL